LNHIAHLPYQFYRVVDGSRCTPGSHSFLVGAVILATSTPETEASVNIETGSILATPRCFRWKRGFGADAIRLKWLSRAPDEMVGKSAFDPSEACVLYSSYATGWSFYVAKYIVSRHHYYLDWR
jgi:hypothetical protein